jgi:capsular polysaccharide biosynthesis protein
MKWLLIPPSSDDLIRLLKAWRFWIVVSLLGAVFGAVIYAVAPPPYRARATVNVDFNLEIAWPEETDRQQFYYLEREVRKLEEIAWSDSVIAKVADKSDLSVSELRGSVLMLSQPAEAGWHFYAEDQDPEQAILLASTWADAFVEKTRAEARAQSGLSSFIRVEATQVVGIPVSRSISQSAYMLSGLVLCLVLSAGLVLFVEPGKIS